MKRSLGKTTQIASLLKGLFKGKASDSKLKEGLQTERIKEVWVKATNDVYAKYTDSIKLKGSQLFVKISSPTVRSDLFWQETKITKNLNHYLESDGIEITSIYWM